MTDKIEITKHMMREAADYIPEAEKSAWASNTATKCFDRLEITADGEMLPQMYMVNYSLKCRYLMTALVSKYLKETYEADEQDPELMSLKDYDRWAGSHVVNQVERWKQEIELRNKCYDLLADFHDLEKHLSSQIMGLLAVQNDSVMRQGQYNVSQMRELPKVIEQLKELQEGRANGDAAASV